MENIDIEIIKEMLTEHGKQRRRLEILNRFWLRKSTLGNDAQRIQYANIMDRNKDEILYLDTLDPFLEETLRDLEKDAKNDQGFETI